jgi:hypothetical protein
MMSDEKVVFLKFKGSNVTDEHFTLTSCANCKNKTFTVTHDGEDYPLMKCAACGQHIGRIGWAE